MDTDEKGALLQDHDHYTSLKGDKYFAPAPAISDLKSLEKFRKSDAELKALPENVREFYQAQNNQIDAFAVAAKIKATGEPEKSEEDSAADSAKGTLAIRISFICNIVLFGLKIAAAALSASLAVIASAIDSLLDLLSGSILFITSRAMERSNPYKYPEGKSRLEPLGVVIFAIVMAMAAIQLLSESAQVLVNGLQSSPERVSMTVVPITVLCFVIGVKTALFIYCTIVYKSGSSGNMNTVEALSQDHFNDVATNIIALAAALLASRIHSLWFFDPIGAIVLSIYIVRNWVRTGKGQFRYIVGKAAPPDFLAQITYMTAHHDPAILRVDTVLAYHWGMKFLVEVHIALAKDTSLKVAHDVGETLEESIEKLDLVERAFVHLDYEWLHTPEYHRRQKKTGGESVRSQGSIQLDDHSTEDEKTKKPIITKTSSRGSTDSIHVDDENPSAGQFLRSSDTNRKSHGTSFKVVDSAVRESLTTDHAIEMESTK